MAQPARQPVTISGDLIARILFAGRSSSLSAQIVNQVRDQLFARQLKPGDFLGTEKDLAARFGASRIVARDALRTLEAQGIVEIKVGAGAVSPDGLDFRLTLHDRHAIAFADLVGGPEIDFEEDVVPADEFGAPAYT